MSSARILAIGEALMDVVATPTSTKEYCGGSPMNVAVGLGRLGENVQLLTRIGRDARGERMTKHLRESNVTLAEGSVGDTVTSSSTATIDADGVAKYDFQIEWSLDSVPSLPESTIVHTGSIGSFLEPGSTQLRHLLGQVSPTTVITFDPNIRPSLQPSHEAGLAVVEKIAALATVIKLSDEDAEWLYGETAPDAVIDTLLSYGPGLAVLTRGPHGALLATPTERLSIAGHVVAVSDTIGAGDSFMSGLIYTIASLLDENPGLMMADLTQEQLGRIGDFAVACAAITVGRTGSNPPTLAEVNSLLNS